MSKEQEVMPHTGSRPDTTDDKSSPQGTVRDPGAGLPEDMAVLVQCLKLYATRSKLLSPIAEAMRQAADTLERLAKALAEADAGWLREHLFGRDSLRELGYVGLGENEWHVFVRGKYHTYKPADWRGKPIIWHENVGETFAARQRQAKETIGE